MKNSKKIRDCSLREIDEVCIPLVAKVFFNMGRKDKTDTSKELEWIYANLNIELQDKVPDMRIGEISYAFDRGVNREFGDFYGLNVNEFVRFCRAHYDSPQRAQAAQVVMKPVEPPKAPPSTEQIFYMYKNNLLDAFEKNKVGGRFEVSGPGLYDFCNKLGLIIFTTKEKYDILAEAGLKVISDQHLKLATTVEDYHRRPLKRIVECIQASLNEEKPLPEDVKGIVIAKSKFLTLKAFFQEVEMSELDLSELVDNKKDLFFLEQDKK